MKKAIIFFTAVLVICLSAPVAFANDGVSVIIDGTTQTFEVAPQIIDGRTMLPLRAIGEALGMRVNFDSATNTANLTASGVNVIHEIHTAFITVNGETSEFDVPSVIVEERTLVPVRMLAEAIGADVRWEAATSTVHITSGQASEVSQPVAQSVTIATINGMEITTHDINPRIPEAQQLLWAELFEMDEDEWSLEVHRRAVKIAAMYLLYEEFAEQHGITVLNGALSELKDEIDEMMAFYGFEDFSEFSELLLEMSGIYFVNREHLDRFFYLDELSHRVVLTIIEDAEKFAPFEAYMEDEEEAEEEEIFGAKHILITHAESDAAIMGMMGDSMFETEAEALAFAWELHARAVAGEDFANLIAEYGQDPGMETNPEGYVFGAGVMVPEFEQGTRDLEIGEISEPILAFHGIHIILRTEPDPDASVMGQGRTTPPPTEEDRKIRAVLLGFQAKADNAEIVFLPAFYEL